MYGINLKYKIHVRDYEYLRSSGHVGMLVMLIIYSVSSRIRTMETITTYKSPKDMKHWCRIIMHVRRYYYQDVKIIVLVGLQTEVTLCVNYVV